MQTLALKHRVLIEFEKICDANSRTCGESFSASVLFAVRDRVNVNAFRHQTSLDSIVNACNRDLATPAQLPGCTADQLAERLQRKNDQHIWPQQLLMRRAQRVSKVDWKKLAEEFALFLQAAMLKSLQLQQVMKRIQFGQLCVCLQFGGAFSNIT